ncbi:amino acid synthesis family protein [Mesobacterium sp. TK19101]|uniref:Amino acid synthesis family protein n=1 Tax=Mesobacterium hydrothermale TaxID=3111907 RepID=A0ABU6HFQ6_9RHOB|nr:amino acid synthesis family protein [Mesobacterium sp. TK19101]MEC3861247.1 amino acid synthesis family protein [Mesobacterium sp. TK19101]
MKLRKMITQVEEVRTEMGQAVSPPSRRAVAAAVIANPFAGRYAQDLSELIETGATLGQLLGEQALAALGCAAHDVQGYGKAAMVGEAGELEHAAALLHPKLGAPLRAVLGGGKALVPSSKAMGAPGDVLDVPLGHKDAAYVRSHFDGMRLRVPDAPRATEIVVAVALQITGRPNPRVGGLAHSEITGADGLR